MESVSIDIIKRLLNILFKFSFRLKYIEEVVIFSRLTTHQKGACHGHNNLLYILRMRRGEKKRRRK